MIDITTLKELVLEVFSANPYTPVNDVVLDVEKLAACRNVFPSKREAGRVEHYRNYYDQKRLSPTDKRNVNHIIWQLIRENLLVVEKDRSN